MDALHGRKLNVWRKSLTAITQECCELHRTSPGGNTLQSSNCTYTYHLSRKLPKLDEPDTAGEVRTNLLAKYSCGPLHTDEQRLDDLLEPKYSSSVLIQDVAWKTSWERWTIETGGERGSGRSVLAVRHDDDDDFRMKAQIQNAFSFLCSFLHWFYRQEYEQAIFTNLKQTNK